MSATLVNIIIRHFISYIKLINNTGATVAPPPNTHKRTHTHTHTSFGHISLGSRACKHSNYVPISDPPDSTPNHNSALPSHVPSHDSASSSHDSALPQPWFSFIQSWFCLAPVMIQLHPVMILLCSFTQTQSWFSHTQSWFSFTQSQLCLAQLSFSPMTIFTIQPGLRVWLWDVAFTTQSTLMIQPVLVIQPTLTIQSYDIFMIQPNTLTT